MLEKGHFYKLTQKTYASVWVDPIWFLINVMIKPRNRNVEDMFDENQSCTEH